VCVRACVALFVFAHEVVYSPTRREALASSAAAALALLAPPKSADAAGLAMGYGVSEKDVNLQLGAYGLPSMEKIPGGFRPLIMAVGGTVGANIDGMDIQLLEKRTTPLLCDIRACE